MLRHKKRSSALITDRFPYLGTFVHASTPGVIVGLIITAVVIGTLLIGGMPKHASERERTFPFLTEEWVIKPKEMLDQLIKNYQSKLEKFDTNIKLQSFFIVVTVLLIISRASSLNLFGNQIPLQWLHFFVPIIMIFLWLGFGFLLDDLIKSRIHGVDLLNAVELNSSAVETGKYLFYDSGFIDGWFIAFVDSDTDNYSGINHNFPTSTAIFLVLILGTLAGTVHACVLAIVLIGCRRYVQKFSKQWLRVYYILLLVPLVILLASHIQFAYGGANRNWLQLFVAIVTVPLIMTLILVSIDVDWRYNKASVQCLRRQRSIMIAHPSDNLSESSQRIVALIGDSLSTGFYVSSRLKMIHRMRRAWIGNWFIDVPDSKRKINSVFESLQHIAQISARHHATPTAKIDDGRRRTLVDIILGTWHFSHQVNEVLAGEFPDILLLWIGHNSVDWRSQAKSQTKESFETLAAHFIGYYRTQLQRLIKGAVKSRKKVVMIVYGLVNFESFFQAREKVEQKQKVEPHLYPYLLKDYKYFDSMRPEYRRGMIELAEVYNRHLRDLCRELDIEVDNTDVRLVYSNSLSKAELSDLEMLNEVDAWHPSSFGHAVLAENAYSAIKSQLRYLSWTTDESSDDATR